MCFDPISLGLLLAGTAAQAGGSYLTQKNASDNASRQAEARMAELHKFQQQMQQYRAQNMDTQSKSLDSFSQGNQQGQLATAQADRSATNTGNQVAAPPAAGASAAAPVTPSSGAGGQVFNSDLSKRMATAGAQSAEGAKDLGALGGYGDTWKTNGFNLMDSGRKLDTVNNFARGDAALLPANQDLAAIQAYRPDNGLGALLSGLGSVTSLAAGAGGGGGMAKLAGGLGSDFNLVSGAGGLNSGNGWSLFRGGIG